MTIEEAIHKATEGGYHIHGSDGVVTSYTGANDEYSAWTRTDNDSTFMVPIEETFLDPAFWHALGCALGMPKNAAQGHWPCVHPPGMPYAKKSVGPRMPCCALLITWPKGKTRSPSLRPSPGNHRVCSASWYRVCDTACAVGEQGGFSQTFPDRRRPLDIETIADLTQVTLIHGMISAMSRHAPCTLPTPMQGLFCHDQPRPCDCHCALLSTIKVRIV